MGREYIHVVQSELVVKPSEELAEAVAKELNLKDEEKTLAEIIKENTDEEEDKDTEGEEGATT